MFIYSAGETAVLVVFLSFECRFLLTLFTGCWKRGHYVRVKGAIAGPARYCAVVVLEGHSVQCGVWDHYLSSNQLKKEKKSASSGLQSSKTRKELFKKAGACFICRIVNSVFVHSFKLLALSLHHTF